MSHILWIHADPEVVKTMADPSGLFRVPVLSFPNTSFAEFYALAGDYHRNVLFYTDFR